MEADLFSFFLCSFTNNGATINAFPGNAIAVELNMAAKTGVTLIASDSKNPIGKTKPGTKLEVVSVTLATAASGKRPKIGARLCGGTSTCLAVVEV